MKHLFSFLNSTPKTRYIYNAESPSADPQVELLAAQAESARERGELSAEVLEAAMGMARAVDGLNVDTNTGEFRLEGPYNLNFNVPLNSITSAEQAATVIAQYRQLINDGYLDIDREGIHYLADLDGDEQTITPADLQAILKLETAAPEPVIEMAPPIVPVQPGGLAMIQTEDPVRLAAADSFPLPNAVVDPGMDTGTPLGGTIEDLLPPEPERVVRSEAEILQAMQDPSLPLGPEELTFLKDFEIVERLVAYPEKNATIQSDLLQRLTTFKKGGNINRADCEALAKRSHYFIATRSPNLALSQEDITAALLRLTRQAQGIGAVEANRLDKVQRNQIQDLLGETDTQTFLENRPSHETVAETLAVARSLSILSGRAQELQTEIDGIPARIAAVENGQVGPNDFLTTWGRGYNTSSEIRAVRRLGKRLTAQQTQYLNAYQQVINSKISVSDKSVRDLIDNARAAISGNLLAAQAEDDGFEAAKISPEEQARLDRGRIFIDAFAQFRSGRKDLYNEAYQRLNNNDLKGVEAIIEEMLDVSVRHWWYNMWGSENYETGDITTRENGRNGTIISQKTAKFSASAIMNSPTALAQALREIKAFNEAERVMLQTTKAELATESSELTDAESAIVNNVHQQLFNEDGSFNFESAAARNATTKIDALIAHLNIVDPTVINALTEQRDQLIVSNASSAVFTDVIQKHLRTNGSDGLSHLMTVYEDMTGISNQWNEFSDGTLNNMRDVGLFVGGFLIPTGMIVNLMARAGKAVRFARVGATVARTPSDEVARVAVAGGDDAVRLSDDALRGFGTGVDDALRSTDDLLPATRGGFDEAARPLAPVQPRIAGAIDEVPVVLGRSPDVVTDLGLNPRPIQAGADDLADLAPIARHSTPAEFRAALTPRLPAAASLTDDSLAAVQAAARQNPARLTPALDDAVAAAGGTLDDAARIAARSGDEALTGLARGADVSAVQTVGRNLGLTIGRIPGITRRVATDLGDRLATIGSRGLAATRNQWDEAQTILARMTPEMRNRTLAATTASAAVLTYGNELIGLIEGLAPNTAKAAEAADAIEPAQADPLAPSGDLMTEALPVVAPVEPEVIVEEPPTLAEQMEAITRVDIRSKANEIRAIMENYSDYQLGQWQDISNEIAALFGIELSTEEERISFGNTIQARIRNVLGIEEGQNEALEDGKIGPQSMTRLDEALMSVSTNEIIENAEALQNFEAQSGWRNNNRAMAEIFGIQFADDATDGQLMTFGRSIQTFAGGTDGKIGSRTITRLQEQLAQNTTR